MNHKLEAELKSAKATIQSLQDTIPCSHVKCEELLAELTELKEGRDKALENAKFESEKKAKLYEELELAKTQSDKRTESTKYILPAATATGALVATGLMLVIKAVSR